MNGREFLDKVLAQPTDAELIALVEQLVQERVSEDTWLDYKNGLSTQSLDVVELRKDVTAFGNGDGGCLVIGVEDDNKRPKCFASCQNVERAVQQANSVIQGLSGLLFPPPRAVREIKVTSEETVLVIAIPRSARMAHVNELGASRYYLRIADGTQQVPEYLLADLHFGRRQAPDLALLSEPGAASQEDHSDGLKISVKLFLENKGLTWAKGIHGGALFPTLKDPLQKKLGRDHSLHAKVSWAESVGLWHPAYHFFNNVAEIAPLTNRLVDYWAVVPYASSAEPIKWTSVVYVGTNDAPPSWWEVLCAIGTSKRPHVEVRQVFDRLPEALLQTGRYS